MTDNNIYKPPNANLEIDHDQHPGLIDKKRPGWVSFIFWLHIIAIAFNVLAYILIFSGTLELPSEVSAQLKSLSLVDHGLSFLSLVIVLAAVITLYKLMRVTIALWAMSLGITLINVVYQFFVTAIELNVGALFGTAVNIVVTMVIYFYAKRLDQRGYLD